MFERILVGVDGSSRGVAASRAAIEVAAKFRSQLTIITVLPVGATPAEAVLASLVPRGDENKTLRAQFEDARRDAESRGVPSVELVYLQGKVTDSILGYLKTHPQDLIVVGTRGLSRGGRLLVGSVSSTLVTSAPCSVLVVRPEGRRSSGSSRTTDSVRERGAPDAGTAH